MKGIILAGGAGTRLYPLTQFMSKQLLLVNGKPMILYPLSFLVQVGIKEVLLITRPKDASAFRQLLGDGERFGISLEYAIQQEPKGIAESFIIAGSFIGDDDVCLILGDNFFYGQSLFNDLKHKKYFSPARGAGATVFGYEVEESQHYGIATLDQSNQVIEIEEKPLQSKSNIAITGLYCFDHRVTEFAKRVVPSKRGELEITSINQMYLERGELTVELLGSDVSWFDMGTHEKLRDASSFIERIEAQAGQCILGPVDLWWLNYVRDKRVSIATGGMTPSDLSPLSLTKGLPTKSKTRLAVSYGQRLWLLSTALSLVYVELLHHTSSALYKEPTNCCRNHHQRLTGPNNDIVYDRK
ncbi:sugar nucleotidyltransferase [uncultured Shewanella sp.]|uniref:sugar nucleotidyltransferase n=1 Tax=uncultured Shewanella sp. TaxID=173975 RepID=UPI00262C58C5|nr:sugar phosphate nucleotidyltransferase [uncultured Shewanella sp.]